MLIQAITLEIKILQDFIKSKRDELETARGLDYLKIQRFLFKLEERRKGLQEREQKL